MKYKDLNLKKIRDDNGLDFAHFTYQKGMCSCCYGPKYLPKRYWKGNVIPEDDNYTYLLFKNADNGSGHVRRDDEIKDYTCIEWNFPMEKLLDICKDLQAQLGEEYVVLMPTDKITCIVILTANSKRIKEEMELYKMINIKEV